MKKNKSFQIFTAFAIFVLFGTTTALANFNFEGSPLEGRWDLVITKDGKQLPSWLEVQHSGTRTLIGRFVYAFGSAEHGKLGLG